METASTSTPPVAPRPPAWRVPENRVVALPDGRRVVLRPLAEDDAGRMAAFFAALTEREIYYFFGLDEAEARRLALDVASDAAYRLVAVGDLDGRDQVLGYMFLEWRDDRAPFYGVCLRAGVQSAGLGRAMIEHLLTSAAASGVGRVRLTAHPDNWRALRLYQRWGFRVTGEFVNSHQGRRQYRMETDLRRPRPVISEEVTVIPRGGMGVGVAAAHVQDALWAVFGRLPLLLDRRARAAGRVIFVADLAAPPELPFPPPASHDADETDEAGAAAAPGWIVGLDAAHLLIGGAGARGVERAARHYAALVRRWAEAGTAAALDDLPCAGLRVDV